MAADQVMDHPNSSQGHPCQNTAQIKGKTLHKSSKKHCTNQAKNTAQIKEKHSTNQGKKTAQIKEQHSTNQAKKSVFSVMSKLNCVIK